MTRILIATLAASMICGAASAKNRVEYWRAACHELRASGTLPDKTIAVRDPWGVYFLCNGSHPAERADILIDLHNAP